MTPADRPRRPLLVTIVAYFIPVVGFMAWLA